MNMKGGQGEESQKDYDVLVFTLTRFGLVVPPVCSWFGLFITALRPTSKLTTVGMWLLFIPSLAICLDASVRKTLVWVTGEPHPSFYVDKVFYYSNLNAPQNNVFEMCGICVAKLHYLFTTPFRKLWFANLLVGLLVSKLIFKEIHSIASTCKHSRPKR